MHPHSFKNCPNCFAIWATRNQFLSDNDIVLVGYQVNFSKLHNGLFLFNHISCGATLALYVGVFDDLFQGKKYDKPLTGTADCPGYCLYHGQLERCPAECECAYVRDVMQLIRQWPKVKSAKSYAKNTFSEINVNQINIPTEKK